MSEEADLRRPWWGDDPAVLVRKGARAKENAREQGLLDAFSEIIGEKEARRQAFLSG